MTEPAALLTPWRGTVLPAWTDFNGHLRDAHYMIVFSNATDCLMEGFGLDEAGRKATGHSIFTLESHINYLLEVKEGTPIEVRTQVLGADTKRLNIYHTLHVAGAQDTLAANQQMLLNVDMAGPRACAFAPTVLAKVQMLATAHRSLARPQYVGRVIALPPAKTP